jgi:membrane-associated PAP2 superfamily phosphatase
VRAHAVLEYYGSDVLARHAAALAVTACALLAMFGYSDLDRTITRWFFDAALGRFPLTNDWWLKTIMHDAARTASAVATLCLIGMTGVAWLVPQLGTLHARRQELAFVAMATLAATVAVDALKHFSTHACPWDISEFGGIAPYRHLFATHDALGPIHGCFPAAHPLVGYAWLCVGLVLYPSARRAALFATTVVLVAGTVLGIVQIMRGAHFLSHVLWTVWTVDVALLAVYRTLFAHKPAGRARRRETVRARQRSVQYCTSCTARNASASLPRSSASVASMPACVHVGAATVTDRGASITGQPVVGSSTCP